MLPLRMSLNIQNVSPFWGVTLVMLIITCPHQAIQVRNCILNFAHKDWIFLFPSKPMKGKTSSLQQTWKLKLHPWIYRSALKTWIQQTKIGILKFENGLKIVFSNKLRECWNVQFQACLSSNPTLNQTISPREASMICNQGMGNENLAS